VRLFNVIQRKRSSRRRAAALSAESKSGGRGRRLTLVAVASLAAVLASSCSAGKASGSGSNDKTPYVIGALLDLTGYNAALGEDNQRAIKIYIDDLNAKGGVNGHPVNVVFADTQSSESESVNQLRKLTTANKVIGVVGPAASGESIAIRPLTQSLGVSVISFGSSKQIITPSEKSKWMFKQYPSSDDSLRAQLEYTKKQGWNKVAILAANTQYGQEPAGLLPKLAAEYGLTLVASETFPPDATTVTSQLQVIASKQPDVVLVWGVNPQNAVAAKSADTLHLQAKLFQAPGGATPLYIQMAGAAAEGTLVQGSKIAVPDATKQGDAQYDVIKEFVDLWKTKVNRAPNQFESNAWDGTHLLVEALSKANIDPSGDVVTARKKLRDSLESNIKNYVAVNAIYSFSPDQHGPQGIKGLGVLGVKDGKFTLEEAY
jgi:branched-chain amino acid transport system substrate-binding protein